MARYSLNAQDDIRDAEIIARHQRARAAVLANGGRSAPPSPMNIGGTINNYRPRISVTDGATSDTTSPAISTAPPANNDPFTNGFFHEHTNAGARLLNPGTVVDSGVHNVVMPGTGAAVQTRQTSGGIEYAPPSAGEQRNIEMLYGARDGHGSLIPNANHITPSAPIAAAAPAIKPWHLDVRQNTATDPIGTFGNGTPNELTAPLALNTGIHTPTPTLYNPQAGSEPVAQTQAAASAPAPRIDPTTPIPATPPAVTNPKAIEAPRTTRPFRLQSPEDFRRQYIYAGQS